METGTLKALDSNLVQEAVVSTVSNPRVKLPRLPQSTYTLCDWSNWFRIVTSLLVLS
jgi:hypothetical protein